MGKRKVALPGDTAERDSREAKRALADRVAEACRRPTCSVATASRVLRTASDTEIYEVLRHVVQEDRQKLLEAIAHSIWLPQTSTSEPFEWKILPPLQLLQLLADQVPAQRELLKSMLPPEGGELPVFMYVDEVTPGDVLQPNPSRKVYAFHFSIHSVSHHNRHPLAWYVTATLRNAKVQDTPDGLSACMRYLLEAWQSTSAQGVLKLGEADCRLCILRISGLVADEAAIAASLGGKTAMGRKPCIRCKNLINQSAEDRVAPSGA